jgi:hypothetical protein
VGLCYEARMGSSFTEFRGRGFWTPDGKIEILLYLMATAVASQQVTEPWLAQAAAQWRLQATAGFQGAVDAGLDRLIGSDPNRVGVVAELARRVEHDLQQTTVIAAAQLAGAGVGGPGTEWSGDITAAEMLPVAAAMRDLLTGRIAWDASTSPML